MLIHHKIILLTSEETYSWLQKVGILPFADNNFLLTASPTASYVEVMTAQTFNGI